MRFKTLKLQLLPISLFTGLLLSSFSCGGSEEKEATIIHGTIKSKNIGSSDVKSLNLTKATCSSNADSGLFTASLSGDENARLEVKIKGFSTTGKPYACKQSSDNVDGDVGQKFDECMVELAVPDAKSGVNTYAMHRSSDAIKDFSYSKTCTVTTQYTAPKVTVTVACNDMIQTHFQSAVRNPIDPTVTASAIEGTTFSCTI